MAWTHPSYPPSTKLDLLPTNDYIFVLNWMTKQLNDLLGPQQPFQPFFRLIPLPEKALFHDPTPPVGRQTTL